MKEVEEKINSFPKSNLTHKLSQKVLSNYFEALLEQKEFLEMFLSRELRERFNSSLSQGESFSFIKQRIGNSPVKRLNRQDNLLSTEKRNSFFNYETSHIHSSKINKQRANVAKTEDIYDVVIDKEIDALLDENTRTLIKSSFFKLFNNNTIRLS